MMNTRIALIFLSFLSAPFVFAEEPPDDELVREALEEAGYQDLADLESATSAEFLRAKVLVEDLRFKRSNASVVRYTKRSSISGDATSEHYVEIVKVPLGDETVLYTKTLSPEEVQKRKMQASGVPPALMADAMKTYAAGAAALGEVLRQEMLGNPFGQALIGSVGGYPMNRRAGHLGLETEGTERCIETMEIIELQESEAKGIQIQPWTSMNPGAFMMGPACMALAASDALNAIDQGDPNTRRTIAGDIADLLSGVVPKGIYLVNQRLTRQLRVDGLNISQPVGANFGGASADVRLAAAPDLEVSYGREPAIFTYEPGNESDLSRYFHRTKTRDTSMVTIHSIDIWIDTEYLVERKMRMEGTMTEGHESRQVFFERELQDYRNVPDSALYMPYRTVMRAGGVLTKAQQKELAQAQEQLEEFDRKLAAMPASQRQMMENMMGSQVEQMRSLVDNGTVEIVVETSSIEINPSFRDPLLVAFANRELDGSADSGDNLVQRIQVNLSTLGYEPGNTAGTMDVMTQVAISQFQAETGMEVTGEPSPGLADALDAAVASR